MIYPQVPEQEAAQDGRHVGVPCAGALPYRWPGVPVF